MTSDSEYYQAHKDDEAEWGEEVEPRKAERRKLAALVSVRFSPEEAEVVRGEAELRKTSLSNFIRTAALRECGWPRRLHTRSPVENVTTIGKGNAEGLQTGVVFRVPGRITDSSETLSVGFNG